MKLRLVAGLLVVLTPAHALAQHMELTPSVGFDIRAQHHVAGVHMASCVGGSWFFEGFISRSDATEARESMGTTYFGALIEWRGNVAPRVDASLGLGPMGLIMSGSEATRWVRRANPVGGAIAASLSRRLGPKGKLRMTATEYVYPSRIGTPGLEAHRQLVHGLIGSIGYTRILH